MSFTPVLPFGGLSGWNYLQRTAEVQKQTLAEAPAEKRLTDAFRDRIRDISSAEALVEDRALLTVALTAFGLEEDINSKFYIRTILEQNTSDPEALANRLADKRYLEMAETFKFGDLGGPRTKFTGFADEIIAKYETKNFETSIGQIDEDMRLALGLKEGLSDIADGTGSNDTKWFSIMGNPPLRKVFEVAFGLPDAFGTLDIDRQLEVLKDRSQNVLKSDQVSDILADETLEKLTNTFLLRSQLDTSVTTSGSATALTLLQSAPRLYPSLF